MDRARQYLYYHIYVKNYMLFVNDNVQKSEGYYIVKIYKETLQKMKEKISYDDLVRRINAGLNGTTLYLSLIHIYRNIIINWDQ